jgi:hypothetical protein
MWARRKQFYSKKSEEKWTRFFARVLARAANDVAWQQVPDEQILLSFVLFIALTFLTACDRGRERANVLTGGGEPEVTVMDFSAPFSLDLRPAGWYHRTFWTRGPMQMAFAVKDGVPSLRFETRSTTSMLFRHVDLDLADYQFLIWRWHIEQPIESPFDEHTREGDDHPARLFLVFQTATGGERRMEIIWGNKLKAGDYKYIGGFPHYVADGGDENMVNGEARKSTCERCVYRKPHPY